jgi:hypothetical protein
MIPVHSNAGKVWSIQYFPAGAEIKFNSNKSWDGGDFGYAEGHISNASKTYAGIEDAGGNIRINNAGWYVVVVSTRIEGNSLNYTIEFLPPKVYLIGETVGGWDILDENLFGVPANGNGEFISPVFKASSELRMCIALDGIEWWMTEFTILGGTLVYRGANDDLEFIRVNQGQHAGLNFLTGEGYIN